MRRIRPSESRSAALVRRPESSQGGRFAAILCGGGGTHAAFRPARVPRIPQLLTRRSATFGRR